MLDTETKTRIDSARDILVGKVPDPKSQVEQITIALIYKFMDDMDRQSEELGGKASFFSDGFRQYAWSNLMDKRLGGVERLNLYAEAIQKMTENPRLPQLFRDIFKGAFLPYRDPETLNLFLKEINGFTYDHSERLGDAYEYLLSVLSSQGQAGQFRTPRHIIDFIVRVVDPNKNETILDPACGTAGFLISAYKHILADNSRDRPGDLLSADERGRLMDNFCGYDISPDMVRLSRANMYLHGFPQPRIYEYDALTSEERWDERYDVIMANPPFMSPKGGIRPHNRFSIKAKRSEVLFVDYIAEHLNVNGRAGVIVPEGIIFQSQNAYKALRKMLLENYLWCVVSLPPGVFNPYSGVKTSILFTDKGLAKRTDEILFVKIENDGFDLGAQRRQVEKNDLPVAEKIMTVYKSTCHSALDAESSLKTLDSPITSGNDLRKIYHIVSRKRILETTDCNLSGDRYKDNGFRVSTKWPMVRIGDIAEVISGQSPPGTAYNENREGLPFYQGKSEFSDVFLGLPVKWTREVTRIAKRNDVLMSVRAPVGPVNIASEEICIGRGLAAIRPNLAKTDHWFLFYLLRHIRLNIRGNTGVAFESINREDIESLKVPLPPLDVQRKIVAELDGYRKIIEGAKQVVEHYKPKIKFDERWDIVELGEVCENILSGGTPSTKVSEYWDGDIPWITSADIVSLKEVNPRRFITKQAIKDSATNLIPKNNIIVVTRVGLGKVLVNNIDLCISQDSQGLIINKTIIEPAFLLFVLSDEVQKFKDNSRGSTIQGVTKSQLSELKIPLPPLDIQKQIVARIEKEQKLVDANQKLIEIFKKKIQDKLAEIWGENSENTET
jgi:type I restriction enzyme M protein